MGDDSLILTPGLQVYWTAIKGLTPNLGKKGIGSKKRKS